jgi:type VI secretion system protein ImpM
MQPAAGVVVGFYGKLPARGDFVRRGLPRGFTDRWDDWLQMVLAGSHALLGDAWLPAYLEAPIWRFALPPGQCGEFGVLGLMLPSVDKAGRYFPLTFAALVPARLQVRDSAEANDWLDRCEAAGRAALEQDAAPEQLDDMLAAPGFFVPGPTAGEAVWWSDGSPRVPASRLALPCLPDAASYATMLDARAEAQGGEAIP